MSTLGVVLNVRNAFVYEHAQWRDPHVARTCGDEPPLLGKPNSTLRPSSPTEERKLKHR